MLVDRREELPDVTTIKKGSERKGGGSLVAGSVFCTLKNEKGPESFFGP